MKIGIFDSGYGGLTIYRDIQRLLPEYDYIYLGDNARAPYGNLSLETITQYAWQATQYLFAQDCELVIFACNTASANALRTIQQSYLPELAPEKRVLGVIRPSIEALAELPAGKNVAIWGTSATIDSDSYGIEAGKYAPNIHITQIACPTLAGIIEYGDLKSTQIKLEVEKYWRQTLARMPQVDRLLLACTHYPLIEKEIKAVTKVQLITQGGIVTHKLEDYLQRHRDMRKRLTSGCTSTFLTTGNSKKFVAMAKVFLQQSIRAETVVIV